MHHKRIPKTSSYAPLGQTTTYPRMIIKYQKPDWLRVLSIYYQANNNACVLCVQCMKTTHSGAQKDYSNNQQDLANTQKKKQRYAVEIMNESTERNKE